MASKTVHTKFRLREYHMPDGTIEEVHGDGPAPDGGVLTADQMIEETLVKTDNLVPQV